MLLTRPMGHRVGRPHYLSEPSYYSAKQLAVLLARDDQKKGTCPCYVCVDLYYQKKARELLRADRWGWVLQPEDLYRPKSSKDMSVEMYGRELYAPKNQ